MNPILCQHNPKRRRFSLPNDIWKWGLKPQGFSILAYLCYLHTHRKNFIAPSADEIAIQLHMSADMAAEQLSKLNRCGLLDQHMAPVFKNTSKNFFSLPNELFFLNIGHGAITVYAYLLYCEDRRTHQCHPSYRTISAAVHLAMSTVIKHIAQLVDKQFITVENTTYINKHGMKWNGNNKYTILPIQAAMDYYYQQQMLQLEKQALVQQRAKNTPYTPLCGPVRSGSGPGRVPKLLPGSETDLGRF